MSWNVRCPIQHGRDKIFRHERQYASCEERKKVPRENRVRQLLLSNRGASGLHEENARRGSGLTQLLLFVPSRRSWTRKSTNMLCAAVMVVASEVSVMDRDGILCSSVSEKKSFLMSS
jgi:urease accessory protein UreF